MKVAKLTCVAWVGLASFACTADPQPLEKLPELKPTNPEVEPEIELSSRTLAECTPVELWRQPTMFYGWLPVAPMFSPNGGLVTRGDAIYFEGTTYFRVSNGDLVANVPGDFGSRDKNWARGIKMTPEGQLVAETLFEGSVLFSMEATAWTHFASMSPTGNKLAVMTCADAAPAEVQLIDLPFADARSTVVMDEPCEDQWIENGGRIQLFDDRFAVLTTKTRIHLLDLANGTFISSTIGETILDFSFDATRNELAVVTGSQRLLLLAGADLSVKSERSVPLVLLNQNIYAPTVLTSPLAYSPDGKLFAHLEESGELALQQRDGSGTHARIPAVVNPTPWDPSQTQIESVASAAFSPDNKLLAVAYEHSFALFGCAPVEQKELPRIVVRLDGPLEARLGETVTFTATDLDGRDFHGHQFAVDGVSAGTPGAERTFQWVSEVAGEFVVSVKIDDGVRTGEASLTITVK